MTKTSAKTIRLYVSEEQEIFRELYRLMFSEVSLDGGIELCGISDSGDPADIRRQVAETRPDVILLGVKNLDKNTFDLIEAIRRDSPRLGAVLMAVSYGPDDIRSARKFASAAGGAMALFMKQSLNATSDLCGIIRAVSQGQMILDPSVVNFLFAEKAENPFVRQLTTRELEVLSLLSQGFTNIAIADRIYADVKTVENHINTLYSKLRVEADMEQRNPRVMATRAYLSASDNGRVAALAGIA